MNRTFIILVFLFSSFQAFASQKRNFTHYNDLYFSKNLMFNYFKNDCTKEHQLLSQISLKEIKEIKEKADNGQSLFQCKMAIISYQKGFYDLYNQWLIKASKTDSFSKLLLLHSYLFPEEFVQNNIQSYYHVERLISELMEETDPSHPYYDLTLNFKVFSYLNQGYSWDSYEVRNIYEKGKREKLSFVYLMDYTDHVFNKEKDLVDKTKKYINETKGQLFHYFLSFVWLTTQNIMNSDQDQKKQNFIPVAEEIFKVGGNPIIIYNYIIPFYDRLKNEQKKNYWLETFLKEAKGTMLSKLSFSLIYFLNIANTNISEKKRATMMDHCIQGENPYCKIYQLSKDFFSQKKSKKTEKESYLRASQISQHMVSKDILLKLMSNKKESSSFAIKMYVEKLLEYPGLEPDHLLSALILKQAGKKEMIQGNFTESKKLLTLSYNIFSGDASQQSNPFFQSELNQIEQDIHFVNQKILAQ